jgi:hypothetical protein
VRTVGIVLGVAAEVQQLVVMMGGQVMELMVDMEMLLLLLLLMLLTVFGWIRSDRFDRTGVMEGRHRMVVDGAQQIS